MTLLEAVVLGGVAALSASRGVVPMNSKMYALLRCPRYALRRCWASRRS